MELIKAKGGKVTRDPGPVKGGSTVIAFIEDPDGYKFELLERGPTPEPLCQVMLRVGDLDRSINFYEKVRLVSMLYLAVYKFPCFFSYRCHLSVLFDCVSFLIFLSDTDSKSCAFYARLLAWKFFAKEIIQSIR